MRKSNPFGHLKKGALHRELGYGPSQKIPVSRLQSAAHSGNKLERKRAQFALNARKFHHPGKKIHRLMGILALAGLLLFGGLGCQSTATTGGKLLASTELTVDGAMKGWAAWVAAGKATAGDEAKVKAAYQEYQVAMSIASAAYVAAAKAPGTESATTWEATSQNLQNSVSKLTGLVGQLESTQAKGTP